MAPTLVRTPFHRAGWIYEEKVDGYRMLAYKDGARVRLVSRNGVDHTRRYPDVATAVARLRPSTLVLDGELAVFRGETTGDLAPGRAGPDTGKYRRGGVTPRPQSGGEAHWLRQRQCSAVKTRITCPTPGRVPPPQTGVC
jgi:ATP dependent DNA ligase domain